MRLQKFGFAAFGIYLAMSAAYMAISAVKTAALLLGLRDNILAFVIGMAVFCGTVFFLDHLDSDQHRD